MKPINIRLDVEVLERLQVVAAKNYRSLSGQIRFCIEHFEKTYKKDEDEAVNANDAGRG